MRVRLFHPAFEGVGGAELLAVAQGQALRARGHDVRAATFAWDPQLWRERLADLPLDVIAKRGLADLVFGLSRVGRLRQRARRAARVLAGADAVLAYNYPTGPMLGVAELAARKAWQCNEPPRGLHLRQANPALAARIAIGGAGEEFATAAFRRVFAEHDAELARGGGHAARRRFDLAGVARLDCVFAISEFSRDCARAIYGRCEERPVYPIVAFPERVAPRQPASELRVLVHTRLLVKKNVDTVLRGFASFKKGASGARLTVVGEGPERARLEALARELGLADSARFTGFLDARELERVYASSDVLALLTLDEPFGLVYPEAAARGLLLIGPDHGGPREILDGGRLGWTVDAFAPQALCEALQEVAALPATERERRCRRADEACRARYAARVVAPQLEALLARPSS